MSSSNRREKNSRLSFDKTHFHEKVTAGEWEEIEEYLLDFSQVDSNANSTSIFLAIRKQKFIEALEMNYKKEAQRILEKELGVFSTSHAAVHAYLTEVLALDDFRQHEQFSDYVNAKTARISLLQDLKQEIDANPLFKDKLISLEELPTKTVLKFFEGSIITSMDFHPNKVAAILVGTATGDIKYWDLTKSAILFSSPFEIWNLIKCTPLFQDWMTQNKHLSVTRVLFSPQAGLIGVAFSKNIIQVYGTRGPTRAAKHFQVEAHMGSVNDLCFGLHNNNTCIITCGDDKMVKLWDADGQMISRFEGHHAPVFSLCLHQRENVQYIFSADDDGKIKAWCSHNLEILEYDALENVCTRLRVLQSLDKTRMFSAGTSKLGDAFLVEWDETERSIRRTYIGYSRIKFGAVDFDIAENSFLAIGEPNAIKIWSMDYTGVLTNIPFPGMPSSLRFNEEGNLLAASDGLGGVYILASASGCKKLGIQEASSST